MASSSTWHSSQNTGVATFGLLCSAYSCLFMHSASRRRLWCGQRSRRLRRVSLCNTDCVCILALYHDGSINAAGVVERPAERYPGSTSNIDG